MKILIMGGFLGSGKTSCIISIAKEFIENKKCKSTQVVIIENEIGEIGVDDKILSNDGFKVQNMFSGCVCCTMAGEISVNIKKIIDEVTPELIIIESSGVGYPFNIKETIENALHIPSKICCVADAKRWQRLLKPMGIMIKDQFKGADSILVNKIDTVTEETLEEVEKTIREFNVKAKLYRVCASDGIDKKTVEELL